MTKNRRHIYYIDRLFQRRFIVLFLVVAVLITVGNSLFYFGYLRPAVETAMYKSHISIHNPSELVYQHAMRFALIMTTIIVVIVVAFYSILRIRLERFFRSLIKRMENLLGGIGRDDTIHQDPGKEFQDLAPVLLEFMHVVDMSFGRKQKITQALQDYCDNPDDARRTNLLTMLNREE